MLFVMSIKKIILLIFVVISFGICFNQATSIYALWHKKDVLIRTQQQLTKMEQENKQLKAQLSQVNNSAFIEQQARDKLFLIKPGEQNVLVPRSEPTSGGVPSVSSVPEKPYWQQWSELFF